MLKRIDFDLCEKFRLSYRINTYKSDFNQRLKVTYELDFEIQGKYYHKQRQLCKQHVLNKSPDFVPQKTSSVPLCNFSEK